jgi:hypothetical protein
MVLHHIITANEVHFTIQEMNKAMPGEDAITILSIAGFLHVDTDEILTHMDTLASLYYLRYTDKRKVKVRLTFNGKNTLVPPFFIVV